MKKIMKGLSSIGIAVTVALSSLGLINVSAADGVLYEKKDIQEIAKGLTYEKSRRLYPAGWMDIYVLTIDAAESDLALDVIESIDGLGFKASVDKLAKDNGVIAAVNGDFFGSGSRMSSMGQVAGDGQMIAAQNYYNGSENRYAGFFIDNEGVPFIDYVKSSMGFYGPSDSSVVLGAKNKVTDFSKPVYFDRSVMSDTSSLDKTFTRLSKIVVEDNVITSVSEPGATVTIPENGYIIAVPNSQREAVLSKFSTGMEVRFAEDEKFVFREAKSISSIELGLSGGGELLRNGENVANGLIIGQNVRNPRTMIGVNKEKTKIYIVCIDGRRNGIGATHTEAANIMREYGCYDAIHFDGGGSTTMVVQTEDSDGTEVVNVPSEGSLRSVANGIGVKAVGEAGKPTFLKPYIAEDENNYMFKDFPSTVNIRLYDGTMKEIEPDLGKLQFSSSFDGTWDENKFTPSVEGKGRITVTYGDISGYVDVTILKGAAALQATADVYALGVGERTKLNAALLNKDGYSLDIDQNNIKWTVDNESIGTVENGYFVAKSEGTATLTASGYDVSSTLRIAVGKKHIAINSFESRRNMNMLFYPADSGLTGSASIEKGVGSDGSSSLRIDYGFVNNMTTTQAVYAGFDEKPIMLPADTSDLMLWYKGNGSNYLLNVRFTDNDGHEENILVADNLLSTQWQQAKISVPQNLSTPVKLDKIYVSCLNTDDVDGLSGTVYIDDLVAFAPTSMGSGARSSVNDYMNTDLALIDGDYEEISVFGYSTGIGSAAANSVISAMAQNASALVLKDGISNTSGVSSVAWQNKYATNNSDNFSFVSIGIAGGSVKSAGTDQWRYLQDYINRMSKNNIVVMTDSYIWSGIKDYRERDALHDIFKTAVHDSGKNVIVLSSVGESTYSELKDGVRYINIAGIRGSSLQYLRLKGNDKDMYYEFKNIG